ncbi:response regulator transcription factor [Sinorhizobium meliloti]|uniref:response regulator transcription factor n=1 Tax=Rhizobium meliloti TaxID=382 RepID=UPI00209029AB|nr:response regulator transcription factor [Sinorhizobium meliloti]MCO5966362.1 response regulator transcription factor [Sinorhizobium meliloti]
MSASAPTNTAAQDFTILIADDHWVVRESLKQVAQSLNEGIRTEEASSFNEALGVLERNPEVGLLLIDLIMPGFNEFEGLRVMRQKYPTIPVVVVSIHEDPEYVLRAIQHGVIGYIPKSADASEIKHALTRVLSGEVAFPRDIISRVRPDPRPRPESGESHVARAGSTANQLAYLTSRESEIMALLGRGVALSDIADRLAISRQTVRVHLGNAMKKLDVSTRESAIRFAVENVADLDAKVSSDG